MAVLSESWKMKTFRASRLGTEFPLQHRQWDLYGSGYVENSDIKSSYSLTTPPFRVHVLRRPGKSPTMPLIREVPVFNWTSGLDAFRAAKIACSWMSSGRQTLTKNVKDLFFLSWSLSTAEVSKAVPQTPPSMALISLWRRKKSSWWQFSTGWGFSDS